MDKDLDGARIAMTETTNKRPHNRIPIRLEAFYSAGRVEGDGVLANISYSGALIEDTTIQPDGGRCGRNRGGSAMRRAAGR